jgi:DNA polymerase-1
MYQYAGGDGEASIGTYHGQQPLLKGKERAARLFRDLYAVLAEMEHNGACISMPTNRHLHELYETKLRGLREEIVQVLGPINLNSPTQLAKALQKAVPQVNLALKDWKIVVGDGEDLETSTKREVLERESHKHPILKKVLEFRSYRTRHSTFIKSVYEKYAVEHYGSYFIHPTFRSDVTETYRLSSQRPNGQNIPRKDNDDAELTIKKQFVSRFKGGEILDADQSQIEIRYAAWLSQDPKMIAAVESGEDIHTAMAAIMLDKPTREVTEQERQDCKARTFLILYGGGARKLSADLKISRRRAQRMIDEYFLTFSGLKRFIDETHLKARRNLSVTTAFGFTRNFLQPDHWDSPEGWTIQRQAFNTLVQNGAACVTYCSMIWLQRQLEKECLQSKLILQVHDSIVVDVYPGERDRIAELVTASMEGARSITTEYGVDLDIPLRCDVQVGPNWGELSGL